MTSSWQSLLLCLSPAVCVTSRMEVLRGHQAGAVLPAVSASDNQPEPLSTCSTCWLPRSDERLAEVALHSLNEAYFRTSEHCPQQLHAKPRSQYKCSDKNIMPPPQRKSPSRPGRASVSKLGRSGELGGERMPSGSGLGGERSGVGGERRR